MKTKLLGSIKAPLYLVANLFIIIGMALWIGYFYFRKFLKLACTPLWKTSNTSPLPSLRNSYNPNQHK